MNPQRLITPDLRMAFKEYYAARDAANRNYQANGPAPQGHGLPR